MSNPDLTNISSTDNVENPDHSENFKNKATVKLESNDATVLTSAPNKIEESAPSPINTVVKMEPAAAIKVEKGEPPALEQKPDLTTSKRVPIASKPILADGKVVITHVNDHAAVFVRPSDVDDTAFALKVYRASQSAANLTKLPERGEYVLAPFASCYYRALVLKAGSTMQELVSVAFIDYGNTDRVKFESLKMFPDFLGSEMRMATKVQLKSNPEQGRKEEIVNLLTKMTEDETQVTIKYDVNPASKDALVDLILPNGASFLDGIVCKEPSKNENIKDEPLTQEPPSIQAPVQIPSPAPHQAPMQAPTTVANDQREAATVEHELIEESKDIPSESSVKRKPMFSFLKSKAEKVPEKRYSRKVAVFHIALKNLLKKHFYFD